MEISDVNFISGPITHTSKSYTSSFIVNRPKCVEMKFHDIFIALFCEESMFRPEKVSAIIKKKKETF